MRLIAPEIAAGSSQGGTTASTGLSPAPTARSRTCCSIGRPSSSASCLGVPKRRDSPAARITAATFGGASIGPYTARNGRARCLRRDPQGRAALPRRGIDPAGHGRRAGTQERPPAADRGPDRALPLHLARLVPLHLLARAGAARR